MLKNRSCFLFTRTFGSYRHLEEVLKYEEKEAESYNSIQKKLFGNYRHSIGTTKI